MTWLIFIILVIFSVYEKITNEPYDLYQQMKNLNGSCFPLDSCKALTNSSNDHLWNDRKCECGSHCIRFSTCCADSKYVHEKLPSSLPEYEHCEKLEYFPMPVMMVSRCDSNWKWLSNIVKKCEDGYSANNRLSTNRPLTNVLTSTTYKNYYCALCNYGGKKFQYWKVKLKTKGGEQLGKDAEEYGMDFVLKNIKYDISRKHWIYSEQSNKKEIEVEVEYLLPSYLLKMVKPCFADLVAACKRSRSRLLIKQECQTYYSPVKIETEESTLVYKNMHCAKCNMVDTSSVKIDSCMRAESMRAENSSSMSFPHLIDYNPDDGNIVGMTEVPGPDCGENAVFDPFAKKCRKIVCLPFQDQVLVNGKCVSK